MPVTIRWWRTTAARRDGALHANHPLCDWPTTEQKPCNTAPDWVAAWTVNESGMPGLGETRVAYLCNGCVISRIRCLPFEYVGSVTLTPYKEITS